MLLGGINLTRALGVAGIPVIVATPEADPPAVARARQEHSQTDENKCAKRSTNPNLHNRSPPRLGGRTV